MFLKLVYFDFLLASVFFSSKAENMNCPLCCEGYMETVAGENDSEDDLTDELQDVSTLDSNYSISETGKENNTKCNNSDNITRKPPIYKKGPTRKRGRPRKYSDPYEV